MFIAPQLAKSGDPGRSIRDAVLEPKYDGHRILAYVGDGEVKFYARTGADKSAHLPSIARCLLQGSIPAGTLLDGEIVGKDWSAVQRVLGANPGRPDGGLTYMVFDMLAVGGVDCRDFAYHTRRILLTEVFTHYHGYKYVQMVPSYPYTPDAVDALIADGWEGAIIKDRWGRYYSGKRGHGWVKVKATETLDVVVVGYTEGKGKYEGQVGALIFGQYGPDGFEKLGQCSGMTDEERQEFTDMRDLAPGHGLGTVIEVRHMGRMPSGGLRHPQFLRLRTDKTWRDCAAPIESASPVDKG